MAGSTGPPDTILLCVVLSNGLPSFNEEVYWTDPTLGQRATHGRKARGTRAFAGKAEAGR